MEKINKIICTDDSRSHITGLLPFVRYGGSGNTEFVTSASSNGNYGHYVCDFCIYDDPKEGKELSRLKYIDALRLFYECETEIKMGTYVKKREYTTQELVKRVCDGNDLTEETTKFYFMEHAVNSLDQTRDTYTTLEDFVLLSNQYFYETPVGYVFNPPSEYDIVVQKIADEGMDSLTDEEKRLNNTIREINNIIAENDYFLLISKYDRFIEINNWWNDWFGENKRNILDSNYTPSNNLDLNFYLDFEKYALGRVNIDDQIFIDSNTPHSIFYTNYKENKAWFETHDRSIWDENGGEAFYDYLCNIQPVFPISGETRIEVSINIKGDQIITTGYFAYAPPIMDLQILINCEEEFATYYNVYEHSIYNGVIEDAIKPYNEQNDLKATFVTSSETETYLGVCETKLTNLIHPSAMMVSNNIFGVFETYNENGGQLFKCTYYSAKTTAATFYSCDVAVHYVSDESDIPFYDSGETRQVRTSERIPKPISNPYQIVGLVISEKPLPPTQLNTEDMVDENGQRIKRFHWKEEVEKTYQWWECEKIEPDTDGRWWYENYEIVCGDGEMLRPYIGGTDTGHKKTHKYRNVTILECAPKLVITADSGDTFFFLARYDNGKVATDGTPLLNVYGSGGTIRSLDIPFKVGEHLNEVTYDDGKVVYDTVISSAITNENELTITYAIGVTEGDENKTGIHYEDVFFYEKDILKTVELDGVSMVNVYCNFMNSDITANATVYDTFYNAIRKTQKSKIIGMEVGSIWTSDNAVEAMLFTRDGFENLKEEPKYNINLLYNRGNAAAWENHFKLSECNTMEDLENYGNNFFNL
jgi:hypothetical protein